MFNCSKNPHEENARDFIKEGLEAVLGEYSTLRWEIQTFKDSGVLTENEGLVLKVGNCEFQITIVQSR